MCKRVGHLLIHLELTLFWGLGLPSVGIAGLHHQAQTESLDYEMKQCVWEEGQGNWR